MLSDPITDFSGTADSLIVERAVFVRRFWGWKEKERILVGRYNWDSDGRMSASEQNGELVLYGYSEKGNLAACYTLDSKGQMISRETFESDEDGRTLNRTIKNQITSDVEKWDYEYDKSGRICAQRKGNSLYVEKRSSKGLLEQEYTYNGTTPDLVTDYVYNEKDLPVSVTVKDAAGKIQRQTLMTWDEHDRLASEIKKDSSGRPLLDHIYAYGASHAGNWLERVTWVNTGKRHLWKRSGRRPLEVYYRAFTLTSSTDTDQTEKAPAAEDQNQTLAFANGIYKGQVRSGMPEGKGEFSYNNETRYEGEFKNGVLHGSGALTWADGRRMEGCFVHGLLEGPGTCSWSDGSRYTGEFKGGLMHGPGEFVWADGTLFKGLFEKGKRTDQGMWERPNDK